MWCIDLGGVARTAGNTLEIAHRHSGPLEVAAGACEIRERDPTRSEAGALLQSWGLTMLERGSLALSVYCPPLLAVTGALLAWRLFRLLRG